jgi:hypothetical protein
VIEMNKHGKARWPEQLSSTIKKGQPELPFEKLYRERWRAKQPSFQRPVRSTARWPS